MKLFFFLLRYICLLALLLVISYAIKGHTFAFTEAEVTAMPDLQTEASGVWTAWLHTDWYVQYWFYILAAILLLLGLVKGVTALWNMLYALSITCLLGAASVWFIGLPYALPSATATMPQIQQLPHILRAEIGLLTFLPVCFLLGLIFSNSRLRILLLSILCYALWYGLSELFTYLLHLWESCQDPWLPELLVFVTDTRWMIVVLTGAFFFIYTLVLAFYDTFDGPKHKPRREQVEQLSMVAAPAPQSPPAPGVVAGIPTAAAATAGIAALRHAPIVPSAPGTVISKPDEENAEQSLLSAPAAATMHPIIAPLQDTEVSATATAEQHQMSPEPSEASPMPEALPQGSQRPAAEDAGEEQEPYREAGDDTAPSSSSPEGAPALPGDTADENSQRDTPTA